MGDIINFTDRALVIFGFAIYYYGIIIVTGILGAGYVAYLEAKRRKLNADVVFDLLTWIALAGIVGARLWHVLTPPPSMLVNGQNPYWLNPALIITGIRSGGLGIVGGVIGGVLAAFFLARKYKLHFPTWLDIGAPALAFGQAVGRWGNLVNQELFGGPTDLAWGIYIDPQNRPAEFINETHFHPTFLYESLWSFGTVILLLWISRKFDKQLKPGDVFLVYMIAYPVIRIIMEFIRLDSSMFGVVNANQIVMVFVALFAVGALIYRHKFAK